MSNPDPQKTVFISYRRSVGSYLSLLLFKDLTAREFDVFRDVDSIGSGEFENIILNQIAARAHFVVLLTRGTLDCCTDPDDWLRREIEHAVDLKRNIVPVMVDGFQFEDGEKHLVTHKLRRLMDFQGQPLVHDFYDAAVEQLVTRKLTRPVDVELQPTPLEQKEQ